MFWLLLQLAEMVHSLSDSLTHFQVVISRLQTLLVNEFLKSLRKLSNELLDLLFFLNNYRNRVSVKVSNQCFW